MGPTVLGVEFVDVHFFALFPELGVGVEYFFQNSYLHITDLVPLLVKMEPCGFAEITVCHISFVLQKSLLYTSFTLPNVLLGAALTPQQINAVGRLTVS